MKALTLASLLTVLACTGTSAGQKCSVRNSTTSDSTRSGGNQTVTMHERSIVSIVRGYVLDGLGEPVGEALIEIFDKPDWMLKDSFQRDAQNRLVACNVNRKGYFSITGLRKGKYELRVSGGGPWNVLHVHVRVDPKRGRRKALKLEPTLGT